MDVGKAFLKKGAQLIVLIDPDKAEGANFERLLELLSSGMGDFLFVGGSSSRFNNITTTIEKIKRCCDQPVLLFPGNQFQLSEKADGILLPVLISGRNPDFLIGKHVEAASIIRSLELATIPTGYILVGHSTPSAAEYVSNTRAIPAKYHNLICQTAMAGELIGLRCIYLEGGSGSSCPLSPTLIDQVRMSISIPVVVGGGYRSPTQVIDAYRSGAHAVVIGTALEEEAEILIDMTAAINRYTAEYA